MDIIEKLRRDIKAAGPFDSRDATIRWLCQMGRRIERARNANEIDDKDVETLELATLAHVTELEQGPVRTMDNEQRDLGPEFREILNELSAENYWGQWHVNTDTMTLVYEPAWMAYTISRDQLQGPDAIARWVVHLSGKTWVTVKILRDFVEAATCVRSHPDASQSHRQIEG